MLVSASAHFHFSAVAAIRPAMPGLTRKPELPKTLDGAAIRQASAAEAPEKQGPPYPFLGVVLDLTIELAVHPFADAFR